MRPTRSSSWNECVREQQYSQVDRHLEKASNSTPVHAAHIWLARSYQVSGRWDKAVSILDLTDQNRDKLTPEMALFSDRLRADSQGKYEEGMRLILELRKLAPREPIYILTAAIIGIAVNKPRLAIDLFEKTEVPEEWLKTGPGRAGLGIGQRLLLFRNHKKSSMSSEGPGKIT